MDHQINYGVPEDDTRLMRLNELLEKSKNGGVTVEERDEARSLYLQLAELRKTIAGPNTRVYGGLSPEGVISRPAFPKAIRA